MLNEHASLGALIVTLLQQIPEVEKAARKTPAKTMIAERAKVKAAQLQLPIMKDNLLKARTEHRQLTLTLECSGAWGRWRQENPGKSTPL